MLRFAVTRPWIPVLLLVLALSLLPSLAQGNPPNPVRSQLDTFDAPVTLQLEMLEPVTGVVYDGTYMLFKITIQDMSTSVSYPTTEVRFYFYNSLYDFVGASHEGVYSHEPSDLQFVIWRTSTGTGDPAFGPGRQWVYYVRLQAHHTVAGQGADLFATFQVFDSSNNASQTLRDTVYFDLALRPTPTPVAPKIRISHSIAPESPQQVGDRMMLTLKVENLDTVTISRMSMTLNYAATDLDLYQTTPVPGDQAPGWLHWGDLTADMGDIEPGTSAYVFVDFYVLAPCPPGSEISIEVTAEAQYGGYAGRTYATNSFTLMCEAVPEAGDLQAEVTVPAQLPVGVPRYYVVRVNNMGHATAYDAKVIIFTDGLVFDGMVGPGSQILENSYQLDLGTIPPGGSRAGAILCEVPADAPVGKVFHTWAGYSADDVAQVILPTDITVIASPPARTPTPTPLPANSGDIACQLLDPADGEMAIGEQMTIRLRATNTGSNAFSAIAVLLNWDAGCLDYVESDTAWIDPEVSPDGGSWLYKYTGAPYLQPGSNVDMSVTLKAKDACGLTTLGAALSNPDVARGGIFDRCSSTVTIVKPGGFAAGPALAQQRPQPVAAATDSACTQLLANRTFELTQTQSGAPLFWETAGILAPRTVTETVHGGSQAMLIGLPGLPEAAGDGWAWQWVTIPADAQSAVLRFHSRVIDSDSDPAWDRFEAGVLNVGRMRMDGSPAITATHDWSVGSVDLSHYAGQTVAVAFHVRQDGNGGRIWAFVDDVSLCVEPPAIPPPAPVETGTEGICWQDDAVDYAPVGMPDFDQVRQGGKSSLTGTWTHDAPAAAADALWWLDSVTDPGASPPPTIADSFGLVTAYDAAYDDHSAYNVPNLIADLAARFGTGATGTRPGTVVTALRQYITSKGLQNQFTVTLHRDPTKELLGTAAAEGDAVILLLGFWEWQGMGFARLGGHYTALAGYNCNGDGPRLALSDPWRDAAETGADGFVSPWYRHAHSGSPLHTPHDNALVASQDVYPVGEAGGVAMLAGYSRDPHDLANFAGLNFALEQGDPATYQGGLVFTRLDYAIVIAPSGSAAAQSATTGAPALLHGTLTRQGWPTNGALDFPLLVTLWRPYDFFPTYAWALNAYGGAEFTTPAFDQGTYTARVRGEGTLANVRLFEELPAGTTHLDFGMLLAGDIIGDDCVDALDVSALVGAIASGSTDNRFDLNADGTADGADLALIRANYGHVGGTLVGMGSPPSEQADSDGVTSSAAESAAYLAIVPSVATAHMGYSFPVAVMVYAPGGPIDTVEVHLQFDPTLLQVVDAGGNPAPYITATGALPTIVQNKVDNGAGRIDFTAATLSPAGFQGAFAIAHIRFKPMGVSDGTWVRFLSHGLPATQAVWRGTPVLRRFVGAEVEIGDEAMERIHLPVVAHP